MPSPTSTTSWTASPGGGQHPAVLSEMTAKAIDLLSQNDQGYFLMVEGAYRPCPACHQRQRSLIDAVALDEAVKTALGKGGPERYPDRGHRRPRPP